MLNLSNAPATDEDSARFEENFRRCSDKAFNFAYRLSGNEQDARDLVQEAFSHALRHYGRYDHKRPFEPWLNRILKNIYLDGVRRYEKKHVVSMDGPSPIEDMPWENIMPGKDKSPVDQLEKSEAGTLIQRALESLPLQYRSAVTLCDIEKLSYERIGEIMDCPVGTVRSRIHQGRQLLKKAFERLQNNPRRDISG